MSTNSESFLPPTNYWFFVRLYLLGIFLFSIIYVFLGSWDTGGDNFRPLGFPESLYFSIVTITTLGYGDISPCSGWQKAFVSLEVLFGIGTFGLLLVWIGKDISVSQHEAFQKQEQARRDRPLMGVYASLTQSLNTVAQYFDCTDPRRQSMYRFKNYVFDRENVQIEKTYFRPEAFIDLQLLRNNIPINNLSDWITAIESCKYNIQSTLDSSGIAIVEDDLRNQIEDFFWAAESSIHSLRMGESSERSAQLLAGGIETFMKEVYFLGRMLLKKADKYWDVPDKHREYARSLRIKLKHEKNQNLRW